VAERLHAGFGKARLKDPVGLEMAGYGYFLNRRCTGVMDHLHVHCVTLRTPKTKAVLISADLIGLRPSLAEEIRKHMFVFEDMIKLSPQSVQRVLKDVEQSDLIIALKGAGDDVKKFILSNVSKHQQEMILDDLEVMGPLKRRDVEDAQQKIVNVVRSLDDSGEIVISRGDGSDVVL